MKSTLRISGGELKGRVIDVPKGIRPTSGRVRESLMSIWQDRLPGARVLDLFAGSGAVGLEAVSRGASGGVLVEGERRVYRVLERNCAAVAPKRAQPVEATLPAGLGRWSPRIAREFDLLFADPPYDFGAYRELLEALSSFVVAAGRVALEHAADAGVPERSAGLRLESRRRYGDSWLSLYRPV